MKAKVARRIVANVESGRKMYNQATLRKASFIVGRPLLMATPSRDDVVFYPKGLKGEFVLATSYQPHYHTQILEKGKAVEVVRDYSDENWSHVYAENEFNYVRDLEVKPGTTHRLCSAGSWLPDVCITTTKIALALGMKVRFDWNGILVKANPTQTSDEVYSVYDAESNRRAEEYHNSEEYKQYLAKRTISLSEKQARIDALIARQDAVTTQEEILDWVYDFTVDADDIGVNFEHQQVADFLKSRGYINSENVIEPDSDGCDLAAVQRNDLLRLRLQTDKDALIRFVIGQAIWALEVKMPPHPNSTLAWIDQIRGTEPTDDDDDDDEPDGSFFGDSEDSDSDSDVCSDCDCDCDDEDQDFEESDAA